MKGLAAIGAIGVMASCIFAQGLTTTATKNDWEEINFEFNSSILSDGYPSLLRLADLLGQHKDYQVKVIGHTDYVGSAAYNDKLAVSRGNTVRDFLVKYGAGAAQITASGDGKRNPGNSNATQEGRFMNRRVILTVTDGQGKVVSVGGVGEAINAFQDVVKKQEECCNLILKRLDKLDDILAAIKDLKGENNLLKSEVADLRNQQNALKDQVQGQTKQIATLPKPLSAQETTDIAHKEGINAGMNAVDEAQSRNKKFSLLGLNAGPVVNGAGKDSFTFSGRGQFFSPFGGDGTHAVQAQAEYMYYPGRQEGQFDIGLINRWNNLQAGLFSSFKYLKYSDYQNGGALGQGALVVDYLFRRGKVGIFATKGFKDAVLNRATLGPFSFIETYARPVDQIGGSATVGAWGDAYFEGNLGYLAMHTTNAKPGGMIRLVQPVNRLFALTMEAGLNETFVTTQNSGRVVFGVQFGNYIRPKEFTQVKTPVPMDVPRARFEMMTRRVGNSPPVADAGPDQIGVPAGTITLDGSGSYDPDGDPITYQWTQIAGSAVAISGANIVKATFAAASGQTYSFRLTVKDSYGAQSSAHVTVSVVAPTPPAAVRVLQFTATPAAIAPGGHSQLQWVVEGADTVTIVPGASGNVDPKTGTLDVAPAQTTVYTLTAKGAGGTVTANTTVTVNTVTPPVPVRVLQFTATPATIAPGGHSQLSWQVDGADTVTITPGVSGTVDSKTGTLDVAPAQTTAYTLTAKGAGGTVTANTTVTVTSAASNPLIIRFAATPTRIAPGGTSTLSWTTSGASQVSISGIGTVETSGSRSVSPAATTTYTLTASGSDGKSVTAPVTVTVTTGTTGAIPQIVVFVATPQNIDVGGSSKLCWQVTGATSIAIQPGVGSNLSANDCVTVSPNQTTTYTLTATNSTGQIQGNATVNVGNQVKILSFTATPGFVPDHSTPVTLAWQTQNATSVVIVGPSLPSQSLPVNGSIVVIPTTDSTYTLTAYGTGGQSVSVTASVNVR
jgi:hypothetical protein